MNEATKTINYNQDNIAAVDKFLEGSDKGDKYLRRTYTMVQTNTQCVVKISSESRKKCAKSLIR